MCSSNIRFSHEITSILSTHSKLGIDDFLKNDGKYLSLRQLDNIDTYKHLLTENEYEFIKLKYE